MWLQLSFLCLPIQIPLHLVEESCTSGFFFPLSSSLFLEVPSILSCLLAIWFLLNQPQWHILTKYK